MSEGTLESNLLTKTDDSNLELESQTASPFIDTSSLTSSSSFSSSLLSPQLHDVVSIGQLGHPAFVNKEIFVANSMSSVMEHRRRRRFVVGLLLLFALLILIVDASLPDKTQRNQPAVILLSLLAVLLVLLSVLMLVRVELWSRHSVQLLRVAMHFTESSSFIYAIKRSQWRFYTDLLYSFHQQSFRNRIFNRVLRPHQVQLHHEHHHHDHDDSAAVKMSDSVAINETHCCGICDAASVAYVRASPCSLSLYLSYLQWLLFHRSLFQEQQAKFLAYSLVSNDGILIDGEQPLVWGDNAVLLSCNLVMLSDKSSSSSSSSSSQQQHDRQPHRIAVFRYRRVTTSSFSSFSSSATAASTIKNADGTLIQVAMVPLPSEVDENELINSIHSVTARAIEPSKNTFRFQLLE